MEIKTDKAHVLYVDDERNNLNVFQAAFRHNYTVHTAINAEEGLEVLQRNPLEVILTDQRMPEMSGVHFLEKVREIDPYPIRIIMSAYTDVESMIQSINAGKVFYYITKPWAENEVKQILNGAIKIFRLEKQNRTLFSELNANQTALTQLNETLETRIEERTKELEGMQQQLFTTAHLAGMSQVATNVIHNVGNILTSVNISLGLLLKTLHHSECNNLLKVTELLQNNLNDLHTFLVKDEKGAMIPAYLVNLSKNLQAEHANFLTELKSIQNNIHIINNIIATQQSLVGNSHVEQAVDIQELIEDALKICGNDIIQYDITIKKEYQKINPLKLNKVKLLQILINLICNARDSLLEAKTAGKMITIKVATLNNRFNITVCDNGVGIPRENLDKVFTFGFTTKANGHGFGLHSSMTSATEMQGSLQVKSEGVGLGACFILELPMQT